MAIYKTLEEIMRERDISIADVARICNLPDSTVRGIIRRKQEHIALDVAFRLSDGLNVSLERLNGLPEKEPPIPQKEKAPSYSEEAVNPGDLKLFDKLMDSMLEAGFIRTGQDITSTQAEVLIAVCRILNATFQDGQHGT